MRTRLTWVVSCALIVGALIPSAASGRDRPFSTADVIGYRLKPLLVENGFDPVKGGLADPGGIFSMEQIEKFRCSASGNPAAAVDISCNTTRYNQDWNPDNEIAIAVDPEDADHLVAGSNDYFYRFNNSTGARQALVPTGFFTSFDGGSTWLDGQIPVRSGNGAGDPAPAFDARHDVVLMAQLSNVGGQGGPFVSRGNVSVSRSTDGGRTWTEPVVVMQGRGAGIGPANRAIFYDKEWLTVDNNPASPFYGRAYVTSTRFINGLHGSYAASPIVLSWSDDGGRTWTAPKVISGSHPSCTYQETGTGTVCDEDQDSIPEVASDGTLYIHFQNEQNEAAWEVPFDFDSQIMVVRSANGGQTFTSPFQAAQLEDGGSDMPYSVIGRQTVWGHQIRWGSTGNITVNPNDPLDVTVIWSSRAGANPNAFVTDDGLPCFALPAEPPDYDPCDAGPSSRVRVWMKRSLDGGATWSSAVPLSTATRHSWFPWGDHLSDGRLVVAWDQDVQAPIGFPPANDEFVHVLWRQGGSGVEPLGPQEHVDVSVTHWAGQYVPQSLWPEVCGPVGYSDPPVTDAEGKDCNAFHGDYTGLAVGPDDSINIVWTGLNRFDTSNQIDPYTGAPHDGYVQDAMFARR
jgi:hypothetical protein